MNDRNLATATALQLLLLMGGVGCGGQQDLAHRSPLSTDDPAAFEEATGQAEQAEAEARRAEAAALGRAAEGLPDR